MKINKSLLLLLAGLNIAGISTAMQQKASSQFQTLPADTKRIIIQNILQKTSTYEGALKDLMGILQQPGFEFVSQGDVNNIIYALNNRWNKSDTDIYQMFKLYSDPYKNADLDRIVKLFGSATTNQSGIFWSLVNGDVAKFKIVVAENKPLFNMVLNKLYQGEFDAYNYNYANIIPTLLKGGIDPNYKTDRTSLLTLALKLFKTRNEALWDKSYQEQAAQLKEQIKELVAQGADVNEKAMLGMPLAIAQSIQDADITTLLTEAGAK